MPRLNHGTLLENLVVLEVARVLTASTPGTVEFASSFAMPPLTQCWHRTQSERVNNPRFNAEVLVKLLNSAFAVEDPTSYAALLRDCIVNTPKLPVVSYALKDASQLCEFGGPNGALLAALLAKRYGRYIRIWCNDIADGRARYCVADFNSSTECQRTNEYAVALSPGDGVTPAVDAFCGIDFPDSVSAMVSWCGRCSIRIGFLDPDTYVAAGSAKLGQVDSAAHSKWLTCLHRRAEIAAGIMFFADQFAARRAVTMAAFHNDARSDYPRSVVFLHGNYMVGVKLRCQLRDHLSLIVDSVCHAWASWSELIGRDADGLKIDVN
jgi:hypothetical protein